MENITQNVTEREDTAMILEQIYFNKVLNRRQRAAIQVSIMRRWGVDIPHDVLRLYRMHLLIQSVPLLLAIAGSLIIWGIL